MKSACNHCVKGYERPESLKHFGFSHSVSQCTLLRSGTNRFVWKTHHSSTRYSLSWSELELRGQHGSRFRVQVKHTIPSNIIKQSLTLNYMDTGGKITKNLTLGLKSIFHRGMRVREDFHVLFFISLWHNTVRPIVSMLPVFWLFL